jgi:hypothetical protein
MGWFEPREVRRILVGEYEVRYEIQDSIVYGLRNFSAGLIGLWRQAT